VGDVPGGRRQAVRLSRAIQAAQQRAALDERPAAVRLDADVAHRRQVEHQASVRHGQAEDAVPAALDRDLEARLAPEADRRADVRRGGAPRDDRRPAVDDRVPHLAVPVVAGILRSDDLAAEARDRWLRWHR
jgi:hypothetical protein